MHLAIWIITAFIVALWSLLAWGLAALIGTGPSWVTDLGPLMDRIPYGDLLDLWVPGWKTMLRALLDVSQTSLSWLGTHGGWLVGLIWGTGTLLLVGLAAVLSLIVALVNKQTRPPMPPVGPDAPPSAQR